ncbi:hypothetical protein [Lysobacter sp. TAB13]
MNQPSDQHDLAQRRSAARRTALWFGLAAVAVYVLFIVAGVVGGMGK